VTARRQFQELVASNDLIFYIPAGSGYVFYVEKIDTCPIGPSGSCGRISDF